MATVTASGKATEGAGDSRGSGGAHFTTHHFYEILYALCVTNSNKRNGVKKVMALSRKEGTFTLFKEMYSACQKKINSYNLKTSVKDINCVSYIWHIHFLGELYSKAMLDNTLFL